MVLYWFYLVLTNLLKKSILNKEIFRFQGLITIIGVKNGFDKVFEMKKLIFKKNWSCNVIDTIYTSRVKKLRCQHEGILAKKWKEGRARFKDLAVCASRVRGKNMENLSCWHGLKTCPCPWAVPKTGCRIKRHALKLGHACKPCLRDTPCN